MPFANRCHIHFMVDGDFICKSICFGSPSVSVFVQFCTLHVMFMCCCVCMLVHVIVCWL